MHVLAGCAAYGALLWLLLYIGRHVHIPVAVPDNPDAGGGSLVPAIRQLLGLPDRRDFFVDYASAHALTHGRDAYANSADLFRGIGPVWNVAGANPHPPTLLVLVLPFTLLHYGPALAAWALAMVACFAATMRLLGVPLRWALGIAVALAITFPGAYGIGNPVPIIGLGIAVAYRYRDEPVVAGLGVALAAMPKSSGLLLAIPFLLAGRLRTVGYVVLFSAAAAVVPVALQPNIWSRYLTAGIKSVDANAYQRGDNASLLHLARSLWGLPYAVTVLLLAAVAIGMAIRQQDLFWPTAWACVAMLPISWMYSLLSLLPLIVFAVRQTPRRTVAPAALAIGVASGSPPLGEWPTKTYPIVIILVTVTYLLVRNRDRPLWLRPAVARYRPRLPRATSAADR